MDFGFVVATSLIGIITYILGYSDGKEAGAYEERRRIDFRDIEKMFK
jgi:hypothetical protein